MQGHVVNINVITGSLTVNAGLYCSFIFSGAGRESRALSQSRPDQPLTTSAHTTVVETLQIKNQTYTNTNHCVRPVLSLK